MDMHWNCLKKAGQLLVASSIVGVLLAGCGGGGGAATSSNVISGVASNGPLNAATVCAYAITGGIKGAAVGKCTTTDAKGNYSIDLGNYAGSVLFEATGGTYTDEATGNIVTLASPLRSMLSNVSGSTSVAVTALTELAYQQASTVASGMTSVSILAAVANVQANFGVADIVNTLPVDALNVPAGATVAQNNYALALAVVSQYQNSQPTGTSLASILQTFNACLAAPITDCGSAASSVGINLNTAATNFQNGHPAFSGMPSPVLKFGSQAIGSLKYDTITISGLNRLNSINPVGVLVVTTLDPGLLVSTPIDTLNITSDGTYTFPTPLTSGTRGKEIVHQPAGKASCAFTSRRQDHIDPYTGQLITNNTADVYCFESPCGSIASLGQAPAPKGLKATLNPDSTVTVSWQNDLWANYYTIYYGTDPNVVTTDPATGYAVYQSSATGQYSSTSLGNVIPNTKYYVAITSYYSSPADLAFCQSSASSAVIAMPTPTVTGMSPNTGAAGTTVTITGTNFDTTPANNTVMFNGVAAAVTSSTTTFLIVTVPSGATTGTITVTTAAGTVTSAGNFTIGGVATSQPTVSGLSPTTGAVGTVVTITGTNFDTTLANNTVNFNGIQATVTTATATSITVTVPSGATTGTVSVTTAGGTATSSGSFTVITTPTTPVTMSPSNGTVLTTITITGANTGAAYGTYPTVYFNGTAAKATSVTDTSLTVKVPWGTKTGTVSVEEFLSPAVSIGVFTVDSPANTIILSSLFNNIFNGTDKFTFSIPPVFTPPTLSGMNQDLNSSLIWTDSASKLILVAGITDLSAVYSTATMQLFLTIRDAVTQTLYKGEMCTLIGTTAYPPCSSIGITFDRTTGELNFDGNYYTSGNLKFTPY